VIRHIYLGRGRPPGRANLDLDTLVAAWRGLPSSVPGILSVTAGRCGGANAGGYDVGLVLDFRDTDAVSTYMEHEAHLALGRELTSRVVETESSLVVDLYV
jgi:hypothetical protein